MISTGIKSLLIGILLIAIYAGYWNVTFAVYNITDRPVPVTVLDNVMYALFWVGVALVALGIIVTIAGVVVDVVVNAITTYKMLKKQ